MPKIVFKILNDLPLEFSNIFISPKPFIDQLQFEMRSQIKCSVDSHGIFSTLSFEW